MAEYLIQDETLTNLADKIRVLNGTEDTMTPVQMDSKLGDANNEVDAQSALIDQMSELLESKAAGGGAELPELSNEGIAADLLFGKQLIDGDGSIVTGTFTLDDVAEDQDTLIADIITALDNKASGITPTGTIQITENGVYNVTTYASANVDIEIPEAVPPVIQQLTVTENGTYTAPSGVDGYSPVVVNVASSGGGGSSDFIDAMVTRTITEVSSNVESIGAYVFHSCRLLTRANFPMATSMATNAFNGCLKLTELNAPLVTNVGGYALYNCSMLTNLVFPSVITIENYSIRGCTKLVTADFPVATSIEGNYAFGNNTAMKALILRSSTLCSMANATTFKNSTIETGTGYVYVPSALLTEYQSATNWSTYASQIRALEDYTVDGTITGALDPTKI